MNRKTIIDNKIKLIKDKFNNKDRTDEEKDKFNSFMSTVKKDYDNNNFDQVNETLEQVKQDMLVTKTQEVPKQAKNLDCPIHTLNMTDTYGDGWNGCAVNVSVAGVEVLTNATIASGSSDTAQFDANEGDIITLSWITGSYTTEVRWNITNNDGDKISEGVFGDTDGGVGQCVTCFKVIDNFTLDSYTSEGSTNFSWDSSDPSVLNFEIAKVDVGGNPDFTSTIYSYSASAATSSHSFQLSGIVDPADFYVRNVCGQGDASIWNGPLTLGTINENWDSGTIGTNVWENGANDSTAWTIKSGATGSGSTGPSDDVTGGGYYVYTESSSNNNTLHNLKTNVTIIAENPSLIFSYHMYGETMGTLAVNINGEEKWTLTGDQGDEWKFAEIDLSSYVNTQVSLEFLGTTGTSFTSDMAIDNIFICYGGSGCTDPNSCNYNPNAGCDDGSCIPSGCTSQFALNYNPLAECDDGSCLFEVRFNVDAKLINDKVGPNGLYIGGGTVGPANAVPLIDTGVDNIWTGVWATPREDTWFYGNGGNLNYSVYNSPIAGDDYDTKEDITGQDCADVAFFNDRTMSKADIEAGTINIAFGECDNHVSIWDIIKNSPDHTLLASYIQSKELDTVLDNKSAEAPKYTLFAPSNYALNNMDYSFPEDVDGVLTLLLHHVLAGEVKSTDLVDGRVKPLSTGSLRVKIGSTVMIDDSVVVKADRQADNGVIHFIGSALIPTFGCTDKLACNYVNGSDIDFDDGSCIVDDGSACGCNEEKCDSTLKIPKAVSNIVKGALTTAAVIVGSKFLRSKLSGQDGTPDE